MRWGDYQQVFKSLVPKLLKFVQFSKNSAIEHNVIILGFIIIISGIAYPLFSLITNPSYNVLALSKLWETSALMVTAGLMSLFIWDILKGGEKSIWKYLEMRHGIILTIIAVLIIFFLVLSLIFTRAASEFVFFQVIYNYFHELFGKWIVACHALTVFLASALAAYWSKFLSNRVPISYKMVDGNGNSFEVRPDDQKSLLKYNIKYCDSIKTFYHEKEHAHSSFWFVDLPAAIGFLVILVAIVAFIHNHDVINNESLKMFLGGGVALGLVIANTAYIASRFAFSKNSKQRK